jgi:hypothetical protein
MASIPRPPEDASRNALEAWISASADADPGLRQTLLHSTGPALEQLFGRKPPADLRVIAVEESPADLYLVRRFDAPDEPPEPDSAPAQVLRTAVHALAMEEPGFWGKLQATPKAVLAQRLALSLPQGVKAHVLEEDAQTAYLVLPHPPHLAAWHPPPEVVKRLPVKA